MATATCPKCHRQVSLPATDDHSVWVRCPLCSEQYSLRMALDHVPPALEILGPEAGAGTAMQGGETVQNELAMHGAPAMRSDTAAHPEHAADRMPLDAEHFTQADHGSNGEQPLDLELGAPSGQPPAPDQVNGQQADGSEHLVDFELEPGDHGEMTEQAEMIKHPEMLPPTEHAEFAEHDPAAAVLGEYHGDHTIEPSSPDADGGEFSGEGDPEFRIADDADGEHEADDHHAMGGIATLVQSAPPARKRRKAPLAVKLIGVLLFFGFGFLGCYLVYGAFLWMHSDQFHLKQYFPKFLQNRIVEAPPPPPRKPKGLERPTPGSLPAATVPANTPANPPATQTAQGGAPENPATAVAPPKPGPSDVATKPAKPAPNDVAQDTPGKTAPVEPSEDPLKTPPPDLDKPDTAKPDAIAPPKLDTSPSPFDDIKPPVGPKAPSSDKPADKAPDKSATDSPAKPAPSPDKPATTPDNSAPPSPDKPVPTPDKPVTDKPENPAATPTPEKPADNPKPAEPKSPVAAELDNVDAAIATTTQAADNLKSAAVPGAENSAVLKASIANYKAMSHLVTELGAVDAAGADPDSVARVEELRKKAAALAESMGSAAERDTTAMLASKWMASPSRKENGIVVVGTLVKVEAADKGFVVHVKMPSDSKEMTFTTEKKPTAADGSSVVVLGLLTADEGGKAIEIVSPGDEKTPPGK